MSFWKKLFGRAPAAKHGNPTAPAKEAPISRNDTSHALLDVDDNWQFVRESLQRLEAARLRINPALNRELIVLRALRQMTDYCDGRVLRQFFADKQELIAQNSPDLFLLLELAIETDTFYDFDEFDTLDGALPNRKELDVDQLRSVLDRHSTSIFENAASIWIVNEHPPGTFIEEKIRQIEALSCGDFAVRSVVETARPGELIGEVTLDDGRSASFTIDNAKRADLTPILTAMNALIADLNRGSYNLVVTGNSEDLIAIYLRPAEQSRFEAWAADQHYANGDKPPCSLT